MRHNTARNRNCERIDDPTGDEFFELISFEPVIEQPEKTQPKARSGEENFTSENVLHLASHDLREPVFGE